jgi:signal transduction histidine kinase
VTNSAVPRLRVRSVSWRRLLSVGLLVAAFTGVGGALLELWRFGPSTDSAVARVERFVRHDFDRMTRVLSAVASTVAGDPESVTGLGGASEAARTLFSVIDRATAQADSETDQIAITIYDQRGVARAWVGRPSDVPLQRTGGPSAFFLTPSPLGLRLVHVLPISGADQARLGSVAVEHVLSPAPAASTISAATDLVVSTPLGPAALRTKWEGAGDQERPSAFVLRSPSGEALMEVSVAPQDIQQTRRMNRRITTGLVLGLSAVTALLLIGPLLDRRSAARVPREVVRTTIAAIVLVLTSIAGLWMALALGTTHAPGRSLNLLLGGITAAALVALLIQPVMQLRIAVRARRRVIGAAHGRFFVTQLSAGVVIAALLLLFEELLRLSVDPATIDLRHFSLHPWTPSRLTLLAAILTCRMVSLWAGTLVLSTALAHWRVPPGPARAQIAASWIAPSVLVAMIARSSNWSLSVSGLLAGAAACAVAALLGRRVTAWYRHATVAARILALFVAFLVPSLLLYPSIDFFADDALRELIATKYAVEAHNYAQSLQARMTDAQREIDLQTDLPDLVSGDSPAPSTVPRKPASSIAFRVWSQTVLNQARLTSAVELYNRKTLVSGWGLNFPAYTGTTTAPPEPSSCDWELFGEAAPFGSEERRMLHAERRICSSRGPGAAEEWVGSIVVHVVFDPRRLPFVTSQSPYFEVFRPDVAGSPREGTTGNDIDVVVYGWGLGPVYTSGRSAWPITPELFARLYAPSREPFWTTVRQDDRRHHVYFTNDRIFIYALGYPVLTLFDHLVHLSELTTLAGVAYILVLLANGLFTRVARERPRIGRALLREIRASFYRKLFLAFVMASIVPVLTLALVIRTYFARQLLADVEAEAARTAAVAQRVIEQSDALQRRTTEGSTSISDDVMVWISQVIDQDVNIFDGAQLDATSERDLFDSGLLPTRTPDDVYRAIALQRLPSFVGEDRIGTFPYMIAAAPVRAGARNLILTVPLANRQRDIERETDDLDRGVHLAALCFILLGAGIGLSMAERIADPVRRLTRATRRIARGDFDAEIAVRSADELRRLVDAFNSMATELKAQRVQLERTHRIEAWAEMARQVAHEIKNPLTPIQLSAEHLRRVHADRGEPMGPVLESCVGAILGQVRLLRQISAEFSSFASAPTAKPAPVDVPQLVAEVIDPYRTGLEGRIEILNRVSPPLPAVLVDRTLVARALANIVENALHAMPGRGALMLDASTDGHVVTLEVRDTGVGMDEQALARVFEPYFSTKTTGTGLGLPIARRNIELNEGRVEVESEKGRGTLVRIVLPVEGISRV